MDSRVFVVKRKADGLYAKKQRHFHTWGENPLKGTLYRTRGGAKHSMYNYTWTKEQPYQHMTEKDFAVLREQRFNEKFEIVELSIHV